MKNYGLFLAKSFVFSIVFGFVWILFTGPLAQAISQLSAHEQQIEQENPLMAKYWEQVWESERLQEKYAEQLDKTELQIEQSMKLMSKQQELLLRWEDLIEEYE